MAVPQLKDYLPTELDLGHEAVPVPAAEEAKAALEGYEQILGRIDAKTEALKQSLNRFVDDVEGCEPLTETDAAVALREIEALEGRVEFSSRGLASRGSTLQENRASAERRSQVPCRRTP